MLDLETARKTWMAHDGPQTAFATSPIRDVCYGGARVGGKTTGLLFVLAQRVAVYGSKIQAVIFRKSYPELAEVVRKGKKYLVNQMGWTYVSQPHYTFTSPEGATFMVRYAETLDDARLYDGFEWSDIYLDEIGNWPTPEVPDYLLGCLRSGDKIPCIRRSTCMPGGPGHVWVKERYKPEHPWIVRKLQPLEDRPDLVMDSLFIPAKMEDNPSIDAAEYEANLAATSNRTLYEAWRYGRWDTIAGAFFECWNPETMTVDPLDVAVREWDVRWISGDWGWKDDCVIHWHAQDENRNVVTYRELKVNQVTPEELGRMIVRMNGDEKLQMFAFSPDAFAQKNSPRTIADEVSKELIAAGLPPASRADNDRQGGWMLMNQLLTSGMWKISRDCKELVRAIPLMQHDPKNSADIEESPLDHAPDAARYGLKTFLRETKVPHDELVKRYVVGKMTAGVPEDELESRVLDKAGNLVVPSDPREAAAHWNRVARLQEMGERATPRHRIRPRARGYGRKYGSG